jgi:membrane associated rhomboid family serine protease
MHMNASNDTRTGLSKFTQFLRSELRKIFSVEYQLSELKRYARLFRVPPAGTLVLVCLTLGAFVVQIIITGGSQWVHLSRWVQLYGTLPPSPHHLSALIGTEPGQALPVWLTLLTYLFIHGSWDHVIGNTVAGWVIGGLAERRFGTARFLVAYFAGGVVGAFGVAWLLPAASAAGPRYGASLAWCYVLGICWAGLSLDAMRRERRAWLLFGLEGATLALLGWRLARPGTLSSLESAILLHPLAIVFGWLTARALTVGSSLRKIAYEQSA